MQGPLQNVTKQRSPTVLSDYLTVSN